MNSDGSSIYRVSGSCSWNLYRSYRSRAASCRRYRIGGTVGIGIERVRKKRVGNLDRSAKVPLCRRTTRVKGIQSAAI